MDQVTEKEINGITRKYYEFRKAGLASYGKYLEDELRNASNSDIRKAYRRYIEKEIEMNKKRISKVEKKLK